MSDRTTRLNNLKQTVDQYVQKEQERISNEVQSLQAILNGRTGGAGIQQGNTNAVAAVAFNDLAEFLGS